VGPRIGLSAVEKAVITCVYWIPDCTVSYSMNLHHNEIHISLGSLETHMSATSSDMPETDCSVS
jgi:hypothetical protein